MDDDREFRELAETMARLHNPPPPTPRDRMWGRIAAARDARSSAVRPRLRARHALGIPGWRLAAAAVAVLAVGIGLGRMNGPRMETRMEPRMGPRTGSLPLSTTPGRPADGDRFRLAAIDLFGRAEIVLTDFRVGSCAARELQTVPAWAGGMLLQTRVLLDAPQALDPEVRALLEDLELVLAQIAGLSRSNCAQDMAWIRAGLRDRATLDRLRAAADDGIPLQSL